MNSDLKKAKENSEEIIRLIKQKKTADANAQKSIRDKIRKLGFYASDFNLRDETYTVQSFQKAINANFDSNILKEIKKIANEVLSQNEWFKEFIIKKDIVQWGDFYEDSKTISLQIKDAKGTIYNDKSFETFRKKYRKAPDIGSETPIISIHSNYFNEIVTMKFVGNDFAKIYKKHPKLGYDNVDYKTLHPSGVSGAKDCAFYVTDNFKGFKDLIKDYADFVQNFFTGQNTIKIENKKSSITISPMAIPLNLILYGPPGVGKTYKLQNEYCHKFIYKTEGLNEIEFKNEVRRFHWWQVIAASLYNSNPTTVPELADRKLIKAKHQVTEKYETPNHIIWRILQDKTEIFEKGDNSKWSVKKEIIDERYPEVKDLHKIVNGWGLNIISEESSHFDFITFHQNFSYEDFIEGIKPVLRSSGENQGKLQYSIEKGIFYQACLKAVQLMGYSDLTECKKDSKENRIEKAKSCKYSFAIFIDEINRANVSAVFGELITLIEDDKRIGTENEQWVTLPYSKTEFSVPPNLHIIGTMNTADRSVEALDTALRRRFNFVEMTPDISIINPAKTFERLLWKYEKVDWDHNSYSSLESSFFEMTKPTQELIDSRKGIWEEMKKDRNKRELKQSYFEKEEFKGMRLDKLLDVLNKRIDKLINKDHQIGHAYFMNVYSWPDLHHVFFNKIIPLLQEYFYGDYAKMGLVLGKRFFYEVERPEDQKSIFAEFDDALASDCMERQVIILKSEKELIGKAFEDAIKSI